MNFINHKIYLLASIVLLAACTERIDFDIKENGTPRLVVFAEITNEARAHEMHLSKSMPYFYNNESPGVSKAQVFVNDGSETIQLIEKHDKPGTYITPENFAGVPGKTYRLDINGVDINEDGITESYSSETIMPYATPIERISASYNSLWEGWEVYMDATDPGDTKNFYLFKVYKNGVLFTDTITDYQVTEDKYFNGNQLKGAFVQSFDEGKGEIVNPGDEITLEVMGITEEYYDFINQLQTEAAGKIPMFSGPSANVKGNISNGALGFFAVVAMSHQSCIYNGEKQE